MGMESEGEVSAATQTLVAVLMDRQDDIVLMRTVAEWCNGALVDVDEMRKGVVNLRRAVEVYL